MQYACSANIYNITIFIYNYYIYLTTVHYYTIIINACTVSKFQHAIASFLPIQNGLKDKTVTRYCPEWLDMIAEVIFCETH